MRGALRRRQQREAGRKRRTRTERQEAEGGVPAGRGVCEEPVRTGSVGAGGHLGTETGQREREEKPQGSLPPLPQCPKLEVGRGKKETE